MTVPKDATTATQEAEHELLTAVLEPEEHQCCETYNNGLGGKITGITPTEFIKNK
jgi:hypothetical protein